MIKEFKKIDSEIKENYSLKELTTFKIGGKAKYFSLVINEEQLINLTKLCQENNISFLVIGGGSNILISDNGFDGLVIKLKLNILNIQDNIIEVSADIPLANLIGQSVATNLSGLELMTGIPGTIGGAVVGNAGGYGTQISDYLEKVIVLDDNYKLRELSNKDLNFKYRDSLLKENNWILIKVYLKLKLGNRQESLKEMIRISQDRFTKHPHFPSAGSTFKNIELNDEIINKLKEKNVDIPEKFFEYQKIPAAFLIEQLDLKGKMIGGAQVSEKHANHIVNVKNASADDIIQLISLIKMKVRDEYGIELQEEVRYIGF